MQSRRRTDVELFKWPVIIHPGRSTPFAKLVSGRDVQAVIPLDLLWTVGDNNDGATSVICINPFVPLIPPGSCVRQCSR